MEVEFAMSCRPNLFIIGAMKAGTTFLYSVLNSHPDICMSPIKEPNFFSSDLWDVSSHIAPGSEDRVDMALSTAKGLHNALVKQFHLYQRLFSQCKRQSVYCGEASPSYLRSKVAAKNIHAYSPQAKIILLVRDPIERAWSHYMMERNEARVSDSLDNHIEQELTMINKGKTCQHGILESGLYFEGLSRYTNKFGCRNVLVIDQSVLLGELSRLAEILSAFLMIDGSLFVKKNDSVNVSVLPRFPTLNKYMARAGIKPMIRRIMPRPVIESLKRIYYQKGRVGAATISQNTYLRLLEYYAKDVRCLSEMLGNDSPVWTKKYFGNSD